MGKGVVLGAWFLFFVGTRRRALPKRSRAIKAGKGGSRLTKGDRQDAKEGGCLRGGTV